MRLDYPLISADSHFVEPPNMWTDRMQPKYRDIAPRIERMTDENGQEYDAWSVFGEQQSVLGRFVNAGWRFDNQNRDTEAYSPTWDAVPKAAFDPHAMVEALDVDKVWGAIVQPTVGFTFFRLDDVEFITDICRASNDFIAEFCEPYPDRLKGVGMINARDVEASVKEFYRCADRGISAAFIPVWPEGSHRYDHPMYEPLFAAANETKIPLLMHIGAYGPNIVGMPRFAPYKGEPTNAVAADRAVTDYWIRHSLGCIIFSGLLDRYPDVRIGAVEFELAWVPHWLSQMDFTYRERRPLLKGWRSKDGMLPSDYWHRNMFGAVMEDDVAVRLRDVIGTENIMWGNDFPHSESTWPESQGFVDRIFGDLPDADRRKILCDNAARVYNFDTSKYVPFD